MDLFFRLQVVEIVVPPLHQHPGDIPLLAMHFLRLFVRKTGHPIRGFRPAALKKMAEYHWPGNVRELHNVVERAVVLGTGPLLAAEDIQMTWLEAGPSVAPTGEPVTLAELEKPHILQRYDTPTGTKAGQRIYWE